VTDNLANSLFGDRKSAVSISHFVTALLSEAFILETFIFKVLIFVLWSKIYAVVTASPPNSEFGSIKIDNQLDRLSLIFGNVYPIFIYRIQK